MSLKEFINYLNYNKPLKTIGIRGGEKLHENLISKLDNTLYLKVRKCTFNALMTNFC